MGTTTFSGPVKSGDILATGGALLGTSIANTNWVNNVASMYMQSPTAGNATELKTVGAITSGMVTNTGAYNITLNGSGISNGTWNPASSDTNGGASWARKIQFTSTGNDSALRFTVTGIDAAGQSLSETTAAAGGPNAGTSFTTGLYKAVYSITVSAVSVGNISIGTGHTAGDQYQHLIGVVPYGSTLTRLYSYRTEAWNGGGNEIMSIGTTVDVDEFASIASAVTKGAVTDDTTGDVMTTTAAQSTSWFNVEQNPGASAGDADYQVDAGMIVTYTPSGTLATAGKSVFIAEYAQKRLLTNEGW